jgi:hypothetical protein
MARLKRTRSIQWAGVEFQPDLLRPVKPVRLGSILLEITASSKNVAVIGRMPNPGSKPSEFEGIDNVTLHLAARLGR